MDQLLYPRYVYTLVVQPVALSCLIVALAVDIPCERDEPSKRKSDSCTRDDDF